MKTVTLKKQTKLTPKQAAIKDMREEKLPYTGVLNTNGADKVAKFFELPYSAY